MKKIVLMVAAIAAGAVLAANVTDTDDTSWWSLSGGVLTLNNSDADISTSTNIYTSVIGADVTKIVKTGPGAVRLSGTNPNFAGEIDVQAGILMGWVKEKCGTGGYTEDNYGHPSKVTVADGATFEMLATPIENTYYEYARFGDSPATEFYVRGTGLNGMGALRRHGIAGSNARSYATITHLTLEGPTMLWVGMRWGFNGVSCVLDMNGHPLTLKGSSSNNIFNFCRSGALDLRNPCDVILDHTYLCIENSVPKNHSAAQVAGTYMVITNNSVLEYLSGGANMSPLYWNIKSYGGVLMGPNNSNAAGVQTATFAGNLELLAGTTYLYNYASTGTTGIELTGTINGPGALSTETSNQKNEWTRITGGGAGHQNQFAQLHVPYGKVTLTDADRFTITNGATVNGPNKSGRFAATLVITNTVLFMQPGKNKPRLVVGNAEGRFGVVDIRQGAVVTNDMHFGADKNKCAGALYLSGNARVYWHGGGGSNPFLGAAGCAYMGIRDDAVMENLGWFNIGANGGRSFVIQRGGTFRNVKSTVTSDSISGTAFKIGRTGGISHYYQCGGVQECTGSLWFTWDYPQSVHSSYGSYTVDGANATASVNDVCYCITFAGTPSCRPTSEGTFGTVNVNHGGTFTVNRMYKTVQGYNQNGVVWNWANSKDIAPNTWAWLNFDGGILKVKGTGDFFSAGGTAEDARLPTRVTVYAGGATIDTNGRDSTWRLPLEKPYGKGVKSITLANSVLKNGNYICPPAVRFVGDGSNVTAVVDFDETLRTNRGVIVTSPGFGFTTAPTVKIEKEVCDNASFYTDATVEMVDFDDASYVHGGLTKRGAGTLTLTRANTYGGATRLEGGTLAFTHAQGLPGGDVEFASAALVGANGTAPL
ncbi:MAG: autotransporter-associated beta strand repeat-containing protein, partial [Kiritimatiellae bacterium]|nr:autotransporter-associated beta strand repeat-containing protein [Kiritimatiellia bacterium]